MFCNQIANNTMSKEKYVQDDQEEQCRRIAMALYRSAGLDQPVDDLAPRLPQNVMAGQALTPSTDSTEEEDQGGKIVSKQAGPAMETSSKEIQKIPPRKAEDEQRKSLSHQGRTNGNVESTRRKQFLIFIKIILKCLDHDPTLHLEAKQIITECTKKNRQKKAGYDNLSDAITQKLRIAVGERHWSRAETLLHHYLKTRPISKVKTENYAEV